ncbi:polyadenylate-binding protein, cytoplasmic and nuclear isoform X5 [Musa acuminata AAA Group]|uniref:polyadenylate-binding protein, cytoplasmic and nuclear isoform X5 n=1 Tax=Musa acuminata AAA Group TaxID=214697 RepID=UPI0031E3ABE4
MVKTNYTSGGFSSQGHRVKGSEIFVGGFPRSVTESIIHELFSPYGEIIELRMIKDQEGNSKGFCFVRFTTKEAAFRAYKENDGVMVHGKSIRVALSSDQDSLFFGNLHKDWSLEEFDKLVRQAFKDVLSVNLAMYPSAEDFAAGKRRLNRGFAFVQFSSHAAAARAYRIGSKADFLLAGKWHPVIDWAEKEPEIDPEELSKIKAAFIGNLPNDADEEYLKKLFDPLGKVERVALSRKGHFPVGFVHFAKRADLDNAIKEMDGKIVQGPRRGPKFKIQVAVARPVEMGKRPRDEPKNKPLPRSRDQSDSSYDGHISDSLDHKSKAPRLVDQVPDTIDPYEAAVITLPAVVKEHLLQVLRVGIATRYDHQAEKFGQRGSTSYVPQKTRKMFSLGARLCSEGIDLPKESELLSLGAQLCSEEIDHSASSRNRLSPALFPSSSSSSLYDRPLPSRSSVRKLEDITPSYRAPASSMRYGPGIGSSSHLTPKEHPVERRQMKFDPFTGEPYKYDPFTGEPIKPEPHGRRSESFF